VSAPKFVIVLELEQSPKIFLDAQSDGELVRLKDWLRSHSELAELVEVALDVETAWRERAA
jgi:hypothetical protein